MTSNDQQIDLVINRLKRAQYEDLCQQGKIDETQLYMIIDDPSVSSVVSSYLSEYYTKSETSSAIEIQTALDNIPRPDVSDLRNKADLSVYSVQTNSWDLPAGFANISEATKTGGKFIFIASGTFGSVYSNEEYDTEDQRSYATSATFTINGSNVVVQRNVNYVPTGDTIAKNSDLSGFVKTQSETAQDISSNLNIDGYVRIGNLEVQSSGGGIAEWGSIEGNVEDQTDLVKVNYPLDNPTQSSEIVSGVTYKRFDIKDHTIATISLSDATPVRIHFPSKPQENFCRDFIIKIKVTSSTIPQVQFIKGDNDTSIGFEYDDESWTELEAGINYFSFTETERN